MISPDDSRLRELVQPLEKVVVNRLTEDERPKYLEGCEGL